MTDSDNKNEDKQVIENEEREKMLNEENKLESQKGQDLETIVEAKDKIDEIQTEKEDNEKTGEVEKLKKKIEESQKENRGGIRIPTGGIKIPGIPVPGFLRSRSRDKNKEGDGTGEEGTDLLEHPKTEETAAKDETKENQSHLERITSRLQKFKQERMKNPFKSKSTEGAREKLENQEEGGEGGEQQKEQAKGGPKRLIDSIKMPLVSVLPRTFTKANKEKDVEAGGAGLASAETLEDSKSGQVAEDGMETVKLDGEEKSDKDPDKHIRFEFDWRDWRTYRVRLRALTKQEMIIGGVILFLIFLIILIACLSSGPPPPASPPVIGGKYITTATSCGPVEGLLEDGIFIFRGVPYASPPVGNLRWARAEPLNQLNKCWNGTLKAHNSSSTCWQLYINESYNGSEDCLYLDIYTPHVGYDASYPVVVLIDTATLTGGTPGILLPTPNITKSKEVIFVRPNFRLGVFGFLAAEALSRSAYPHSSGNYGLSDIIEALKWVKLNIEHFGGDPKSITLVGHRAGATLVTALASTSFAKDLFQRAWASSGSAIYPGKALQLSEQENENYVKNLCKRNFELADCIRAVDAEELIEQIEDSWRPVTSELPQAKEVNATKHEWLVLDGNILKDNPWGNGSLKVPLILGTTAHSEASPELWVKLQKSSEPLEEAIADYVRDSHLGKLGLAEEALRLYNRTWKGLTAMVSDIRTVCPLLTFTRAQQNISFYVVTLERNYTDFGQIADVDTDMASILGSYEPKSPSQKKYVETIQKLFYNYVINGEFLTGRQQSVLNIREEAIWEDDYRSCNFWISKDIVPRFARRD